jgi:Tol biopolymer transport system component
MKLAACLAVLVPLSASMAQTRPQVRLVKISGPMAGDVKAFDSHGGRAVYIADQDTLGVDELFAAPIDGRTPPVKLSGPLVAGGDVTNFSLTPDGRWVVFEADAEIDQSAELYLAPTDGSAPRLDLDAPLSTNRRWSLTPDGERVVFELQGSTAYQSIPRGGGPRVPVGFHGTIAAVLTNTHRIEGVVPLFVNSQSLSGGAVSSLGSTYSSGFKASPDGTRVVVEFSNPGTGQKGYYSIRPDGSGGINLTSTGSGSGGFAPEYAVTNERLVLRNDKETALVYDLRSRPLDASEPLIVLNGPLVSGGDVLSFRLARNRAVYLADQDVDGLENLYSVPIDGSSAAARLETADLGPSAKYELTPDGRRVIYLAATGLYSVPFGGGASVLLSPPTPGRFLISADSQRVVYNRSGTLYSVPVEGGTLTILASPIFLGAAQAFLLDGSTTVFASETAGVRELYASTFHPNARQR